jgi:hypothetical protein
MGSILRAAEGVTRFEMPREGVVVITYDDRKTTAAAIVAALEKGRFAVKGKPVYVKPNENSRSDASPEKKATPRKRLVSGAGTPPGQGSQPSKGDYLPPDLPLYKTTPDSGGAMSR